jgi:hypothetical protein
MTRSTCVSTFSFGLVALLASCSSSKPAAKPDAKTVSTADAMTTPDAPPAALMGLGQPCDPAAMPGTCPANFGCLSSAGAAKGFCTTACEPNGTFMTDVNSVPTPDPFIALAAKDPACVAAYSGGPSGVAKCDVIVNLDPVPPLKPSTNYKFLGVCGIDCGPGNTCPGGLTCDAMSQVCNP